MGSFHRKNKDLIEFLIKNQKILFSSSEIELIANYHSHINILFDILNADESFLLSVLLKHLQNEINTLTASKKIDKIEYKKIPNNKNLIINSKKKKHFIQEAFINKTIIYDEKHKNIISKNHFEFHRDCLIDLLDILRIIFVKTWAKPSIGILWDFSFNDFKKFIPGQQRKRLYDIKTYLNKMMLAKNDKIRIFYFEKQIQKQF